MTLKLVKNFVELVEIVDSFLRHSDLPVRDLYKIHCYPFLLSEILASFQNPRIFPRANLS